VEAWKIWMMIGITKRHTILPSYAFKFV